MNEYSKKIVFKDKEENNKYAKLKFVIIYLLLVMFVVTIIGTIFYKENYAPKPIELDEIQVLLEEADILKGIVNEEIKDEIPYEISYINDFYIVDGKEVKSGELAIDIAFTVNYPAASARGFGTAILKYKKGWYVEDLTNVKTSDIYPLFSAGETFLGILSREIYGEGMFIFNDQKYGFAKSYVDSLCTMTEEGDLDYTKVEIAPYNKDGRVDIVVGMKYNFDIWGWELVDFETVGTR